MFDYRIVIICCFTSFFIPELCAQNQLSGKINDTKNTVLAGLEIRTVHLRDSTINTAISDNEGNFELLVGSGTFKILIKDDLVTLYERTINVVEDTNLGTITVSKSYVLDQVEIQRNPKLVEQKIDRIVFNVEQSSFSLGGDVIDLLNVTPSLQIINDEITMIGKSSMQVMINDRIVPLSGESLISYLRSLPSDNVSKIEVIATPPAKYEAEGNSGLINIILKRLPTDQRLNASVRSSYQQGIYGSGTLGANAATQIKSWNISTTLNFSNGSYNARERHQIHYDNEVWHQGNRRREFNDLFGGMIAADNKASESLSYGFIYTGNSNKPSNVEVDNIVIENSEGQSLPYYTNTNAKKSRYDSTHALNFHFRKNLDTIGKYLSFDADYFEFNQDTRRFFSTKSFINDVNNEIYSDNQGEFNAEIITFNLDSELPFQDFIVTTGAKVSFIENTSANSYFDTEIGNQQDSFLYRESRQAIYGSIEKEFQKLDVQVGLRIENTNVEGSSQTTANFNSISYLKIFPSAYLLYKLSDNKILSLNYSNRIGRPSYNMMNPFRVYQNQYTYIEGNPNIQPEFVNSFDLSYSYKSNLTFKLSYLRLDDGKSQIARLDPVTNIQAIAFENFFNMNSYNVQMNYRLKIGKAFESYNSFIYNYKQTSIDAATFTSNISQSSISYSMNNSLTLNKKRTLFIDSNILYQSPKNVNVLSIAELFFINIGCKALFLDKNLQIAFNLNDLLRTNKFRASIISNGVYKYTENYYDNQYFRLSMSYKFGNKKIPINDHETGNEEEVGRTK